MCGYVLHMRTDRVESSVVVKSGSNDTVSAAAAAGGAESKDLKSNDSKTVEPVANPTTGSVSRYSGLRAAAMTCTSLSNSARTTDFRATYVGWCVAGMDVTVPFTAPVAAIGVRHSSNRVIAYSAVVWRVRVAVPRICSIMITIKMGRQRTEILNGGIFA